MIVRAKTPKGLSLVGRFAVVGLAALLLPLAPSWAQKDKTQSPLADLDQRVQLADRIPSSTQTPAETAPLALAQDQSKVGKPKASQTDLALEARIAAELKTDPEVAALDREIAGVESELLRMGRVVKNVDRDPVVRVLRANSRSARQEVQGPPDFQTSCGAGLAEV